MFLVCCFLLEDSIYGICTERRENLNICVMRNYSWSKQLARKPAKLCQPSGHQVQRWAYIVHIVCDMCRSSRSIQRWSITTPLLPLQQPPSCYNLIWKQIFFPSPVLLFLTLRLYLAVHNSSIGHLVPCLVGPSDQTNNQSLHNTTEWPQQLVTFETFDQRDEKTLLPTWKPTHLPTYHLTTYLPA